MRKPIPIKLIKILLLSFLGLIVLSFIIFNIVMDAKAKRKIKNRISESPITELAPYSILSPPNWLRQTTSNGTVYQYDPHSNDFIIEIDGKKYHIIDGKVYREDENGLHLVENTGEKALANKGLLDVALFGDSESKTLLPDIKEIVKDIPPLSLTDSEINGLLDYVNSLLGTNLTYDDFVQGIRDGKSLEEILFGADGSDYLDNFLKGSGINKDDFEAFLKANNITAEDFKNLVEANGFNSWDDFINAKNKAFPEYNTTQGDSPLLSDRAISSNDVIKKVVPNAPETNTNLFASLSEDKKSDMDGLRPVTLSRNNGLDNQNAMTAAIKNLNLNNEYAAQNSQDAKKDFAASFKNNAVKSEWLTPFQIASGTVIPLVMINGINSDLPGDIIAVSSENVFDTATGTNILIPKGTKFIGTYDSSITFGQNRVLVVWTEFQRPDGYTSTLPGWSGTDKMGFSGLSGSTDNHIASIIGASALSSLIDIGVNVATNYIGNETLKEIVSSLTNSATSTGQKYLDRTMNTQPTIVIAPGTRTTLFVNKTITIEPQNHKITNSQNLWNSKNSWNAPNSWNAQNRWS